MKALRSILAAVLLLSVCAANAQSSKRAMRKLPGLARADRTVSYGFMLGIHTSSYRVRYADRFVTEDFDTLHSVMAPSSIGFSLGFLVNLRLTPFLDLRAMPKTAFYQHELEYRYLGVGQNTLMVESTVVELPLLLKYRSVRRGAVGLYFVGGLTPGFEASGKNDEQPAERTVDIGRWNLSLDVGMGADIYLPYFKMSPEIRFSGGVLNLLGDGAGPFNAPLKRINTNTVSFYLIFQ